LKRYRIHFVRVLFILTATLGTYSAESPAAGPSFDHSSWEQFLKTYVNDQGEVDYQAVKQDPSLLEKYLGQVKSIDLTKFNQEWSREERLALMLNLYHAGVIRAVLGYYPIKSILEIPGVWDDPIVHIGEQSLSLNQIRIRELIGAFRDEKIHTVLSNGSRSAPRLRREAFVGARVEGQLFMATREFVNSDQWNKIIPGDKKIRLSRIFKWYAPDFRLDFGSYDEDQKFSEQEFAVLSFLAFYLEDSEKITYLNTRKYRIRYLDYDWSLNDVRI